MSFILAGDVPDWLSGTLYRVGPGVIQSGDTLYEHLFDMPSVLHKYTLKPGIQRLSVTSLECLRDHSSIT